MKTCDEMVRDLLTRRDQYIAGQKRRRAIIIHTAAAFCCVCLMVSAGIGVRRSGQLKPPLHETTGQTAAVITTTPSAAASNGTHAEDSTTAPIPGSIDRIHPIAVAEFPAAPKMMIALMGKDFVSMTPDELHAYYGCRIIPTVPDDLQLKDFHPGIFRREGGTGEVYWDGNALGYSNADCTRFATVNVDKNTLPFDFCNLFADVQTRSVISGVEVGLAQKAGGEIYAEFMVQGVGFRIITSGLTLDETVEIIRSLLG